MKIYTKTGDKGKTSIYSGQRVSKESPIIEALGAIDEGNSAIGLALAFLPKEASFTSTRQQLESIQNALFDSGAAVSTPRTCEQTTKLEKTRFDQEGTEFLEKWIDAMEQELPPLKTFILPGGHPAGAALHLARSLIRRAERAITPLYNQDMVAEEVLIYLNRLSDYLFVVSRFVNYHLQVPEIQWQAHKPFGS